MNLYVIASRRSGITRGLTDVFPGCKLVQWKTKPAALKGKVKEAAEWVERWIDDQMDLENSFLKYRDVMEGIGMKDRMSFKRYVRFNEEFIAFMYSKGLQEDMSNPKLKWPDGWKFFDVGAMFEDETLPPPETPEQIAAREATGDY